ncbi:membrane-bound lytic murein transglycosylase MltF [Pseudomaricurvus alcaniphilus]|uniref:membrane-bound lytic murein transglycosylase MltF n=1 Tax=Pseudomaricurvus alcaniphilus TaxID=1166482 RepID=UPI00140C1332|nr:membrane-bound lytic murein transglycosylase MltF [Pseudomaricurvus alcaniphilus]NHN36218.1 membrane-bound lytic murein transglycosylase MltF [Pseudomaricurvus alcaniphilus]
MQVSRHKVTRLLQLGLLASVIGAVLLLTRSQPPTVLELVLAQGELTILSRNGPTTYYEGPNGLDGYEYTLAHEFAQYLGVELKISEVEHLGSLLDAVGTERGQLGAAGLTVTEERRKKVRFSAPYMEVTQQLVYRAGSNRPADIADLYDKTILVISDSAHVETLRQLQKEHPQLRWHEQSNVEMVELIEMVHNGDIDITIVDSNAYKLNRSLYPMAQVAFDVSEPQQLAWAFPRSTDNSLYDLANEFIAQARDEGKLAQIHDRHYGRLNSMDTGSALTFARRLETRLPRWQEHLQGAAEKYDLDWRLLAAISYQESHWNPRAKSYTGVRGLMMLTQATAAEMGITNRIDPEQSIYGGAKYYRKIYDRLPASIVGKSRQWMALAAYNIGFGHLEDARVLTQRHGGDPNLWDDVKKHLPLLTKRKYYSTLKHGYARGHEPVSYVRNIRNFFNTIAWHQQIKQSKFASSRDRMNELDEVPATANEQAQAEQSTTVL